MNNLMQTTPTLKRYRVTDDEELYTYWLESDQGAGRHSLQRATAIKIRQQQEYQKEGFTKPEIIDLCTVKGDTILKLVEDGILVEAKPAR